MADDPTERPSWLDEFAELVDRMEQLTNINLVNAEGNLSSTVTKADDVARRMRSAAEDASNAAWSMRR